MDRIRPLPPPPRPRSTRLVPVTRRIRSSCSDFGRAGAPVVHVRQAPRRGLGVSDVPLADVLRRPRPVARRWQEQVHEWVRTRERGIDVPIAVDVFRGDRCDGRPPRSAGPGAGDRRRARQGHPGGERGTGPWRGDSGGRIGRLRPDGRAGGVRDPGRAGRLVRSPRTTGASDGRPSGDHRQPRRDRARRLRARPVAGARGRDRHRVGDRHRNDLRGVQCRHDARLVRPRPGIERQSRRSAPERARHREPQLRPRLEPADHPGVRRRPGAHPRGRGPHRRSVQPVGRPRRHHRSQQRGTDRDRARSGNAALRIERGRRPRQRHHAARELPRVAVRGHAGAVRHRRRQREPAGGHERQPAAFARERARLGRRQPAAVRRLRHAGGNHRELRDRSHERAGRARLVRRPVLRERRADVRGRAARCPVRGRVPRPPCGGGRPCGGSRGRGGGRTRGGDRGRPRLAPPGRAVRRRPAQPEQPRRRRGARHDERHRLEPRRAGDRAGTREHRHAVHEPDLHPAGRRRPAADGPVLRQVRGLDAVPRLRGGGRRGTGAADGSDFLRRVRLRRGELRTRPAAVRRPRRAERLPDRRTRRGA